MPGKQDQTGSCLAPRQEDLVSLRQDLGQRLQEGRTTCLGRTAGWTGRTRQSREGGRPKTSCRLGSQHGSHSQAFFLTKLSKSRSEEIPDPGKPEERHLAQEPDAAAMAPLRRVTGKQALTPDNDRRSSRNAATATAFAFATWCILLKPLLELLVWTSITIALAATILLRLLKNKARHKAVVSTEAQMTQQAAQAPCPVACLIQKNPKDELTHQKFSGRSSRISNASSSSEKSSSFLKNRAALQ